MNVLNLSKCLHDKMKNCNVVVSCFAIPKPLKLNKNVENCTQTLLGWELSDISDLSYFMLLQTSGQIYQPEKMFGVQDKILQGILLLGPSNTLHILPVGKVSQLNLKMWSFFMTFAI